MTTQVNNQLTNDEILIQNLIQDPILNSAENALFLQYPFLAVWPLKQIIQSVLNYFNSEFKTQEKEVIDITYIKFKNKLAEDAFTKASIKLKIIIHDKGVNSYEYKKAIQIEKDNFSKFIRYAK